MRKILLSLMCLLALALPAAAQDVTWTQVTDASTLKDGDVIALTTSEYTGTASKNSVTAPALIATAYGRNILTCSEFKDNNFSDAYEITLRKSGTNFILMHGETYLKAEKNKITESDTDPEQTFSISVTDGKIAIKCNTQIESKDYTLKYNPNLTYPLDITKCRIAFYNSNQQPIIAYVKTVQAPQYAAPTLTPAPDTYFGEVDVKITCAMDYEYLEYSIDNGVNWLNAPSGDGTIKISETTTLIARATYEDGHEETTTGEYIITTPHTVTFNAGNGTCEVTSLTEEGKPGVVLPAAVPNSKLTDWTFAGWAAETVEETTTKPVLYAAGETYIPEENITLYAVYAYVDPETEGEVVLAETMAFGSWTTGGDKKSSQSDYELMGDGAYVESKEPVDFANITKVIVFGGTYGGDSYNTISIKDVNGNKWADGTVTGKKATGENVITCTSETPMEALGLLRVYSTCGDGTSNGVRMSKVQIYVAAVKPVFNSNPAIGVEAPEAPVAKVGDQVLADEGEYTFTKGDVITITAEEGATIKYELDNGTEVFVYDSEKGIILDTVGEFMLSFYAENEGVKSTETLISYTVRPTAPTITYKSNSNGVSKFEINVPTGCEVYYQIVNVTTTKSAPAKEPNEGYTKYDGSELSISDGQELNMYSEANGIQSKLITLEYGDVKPTGVAAIEIENGEARYFNLQGVEVVNPSEGIYIRVANGKATKVLVK